MLTARKMMIGLGMGPSYGAHPGAWRMPGADTLAYVDVDVHVRGAQAAERGGLDFAFMADRVFLHGDASSTPPLFVIDPIVVMAAIARETSSIGLVTSASTSFNEPYTIARQFRALDVMSHGRMGWNAIPSFEPEAFANYGREVPSSEEKYGRLHETIQITQALWGSWPSEGWGPDPVAGRFADPRRVRPINLQGRQVAARGPLQIPPSEQGQPVIFMPAVRGHGFQAAAMYADVVVAMPMSMEESVAQRDAMRTQAVQAGRRADDVRFFPFVSFGLGATKREALDRRRTLDDRADTSTMLAHLSAMLGFRLDPASADQPLTEAQLRALRGHAVGGRSKEAVQLARAGWSPRDILAHGILDHAPGVVGTAREAADYMQRWFEAEACDGFILIVDDVSDGIDQFVDLVVPILEERGLRSGNFQNVTLRHRLGLRQQVGPDPRLRPSD